MRAHPPLPKRLRASAQQLKQKKHREDTGCVLLEGARLVSDALATRGLEYCVVDAEKLERHRALLRDIETRGVPVYLASASDIAHVSDTVHAQGLVAVARFRPLRTEEVLRPASPAGVYAALDGVADPGNLGTIIRTCDWFGVAGLLLSANSVDPTNPKVVRATMGSLFRVPIAMYESETALFDAAHSAGCTIAGTSASTDAVDIARWQAPESVLLLFGNEAHGLQQSTLARCDAVLTIPRRGAAESLNLAIAHGIFLSHLAAR